ncbi:MAG: hypothetical protein ACJ0HC_00955 [Gammaproteobacteria bacterium]
MDHLSIDKAHIIGASMGRHDKLSLLALDYPESRFYQSLQLCLRREFGDPGPFSKYGLLLLLRGLSGNQRSWMLKAIMQISVY